MGLDSLANVKSRLGITGTEYDSFIQDQIDLVSSVIEAYCRRKFLTADYVQTFYGTDYKPSLLLQLFHYPVTAIADIDQDEIGLSDSVYRLHKPSGSVTRSDGNPFFYCEETVVFYTAGFATCPLPVRAVLDQIVGERYNKKTSGVDLNFGTDVQRISIPGAISIDFDYTLTNNDRVSAYGTIIGNNANILDDWRSERAVLGSGKLEYVDPDTEG